MMVPCSCQMVLNNRIKPHRRTGRNMGSCKQSNIWQWEPQVEISLNEPVLELLDDWMANIFARTVRVNRFLLVVLNSIVFIPTFLVGTDPHATSKEIVMKYHKEECSTDPLKNSHPYEQMFQEITRATHHQSSAAHFSAACNTKVILRFTSDQDPGNVGRNQGERSSLVN